MTLSIESSKFDSSICLVMASDVRHNVDKRPVSVEIDTTVDAEFELLFDVLAVLLVVVAVVAIELVFADWTLLPFTLLLV